jgi:dTDP-4-amino-4,6-dideoxygalactose transaminase
LPDAEVWQALHRVFEDGTWGTYLGGNVAQLEERLRAYHETAFAVTCGSGTFAVEAALRALKVGPGDEVILSAYDYPGNFLAVHAVGAHPVLVDVAPANWNLGPDRVAAAAGPRTRAVIAAHLHGGLVPMRQLMALARAHGLAVIEDAAQSPGALVEGRRAGTWGDAGILSFGGSKLLSAGRGGAILTPHAEVQQRLRLVLQRGNHICPLSELQAAVLIPQLDRLEERNCHRLANVRRLLDLLARIPGLRPFTNDLPGSMPAFFKLGFQYDAEAFGLPRATLVAALRAEGMAFSEGFRGLHVGRSARRFRAGTDLTEADRAHRGIVGLHHPILLGTAADMETIASAIQKIHEHAGLLADQPVTPADVFDDL